MLRRSKRIAEIEKRKNQPEDLIKKPKLSEELIQREIEELNANIVNLENNTRRTDDRCATEKTENDVLRLRIHVSEMSTRRAKHQTSEVKITLKKTTKEAGSLKKQIGEMLGELENFKDFDEAITKAKKETSSNRQKWMEEIEKIQEKQEEKNGGPIEWKMCEICAFEYSEEEKKVPRVLNCGHTICTECAGNFIMNTFNHHNTIRCPFDRQLTQLRSGGVYGLPRNCALVNL
ncbi:hypothetical protein CRE_28763 [Caenorhabditis remanei]|uniref:Uncharacterized protein n=1 Tax=Caenorhabditis remanei TaxID=31234 RepID=E3MJW3_CAERE|nr:hypothetical protein CRE_28763 [Caenorhabditis remanei]